MKTRFITLMMVLGLLFSYSSSNAQLADGSVAPDFTITDMNGVSHNLYTYLDQGYTVILDMYATWCGPCWVYAQKHHFKSMWEKHGPAGAPGVSANTTNDVIVIAIDVDPATTDQDMYGTTSASQGDWVTGTVYPIANPASAAATALNNAYNVAYFPTVYRVCRDRIVTEIGQLDSNALYASTNICPTTGPTAGANGKIISKTDEAYVCNSANTTAQVKFQNYSNLPLTAATVQAMSGTTVLGTAAWTGNLATYATGSQAITYSNPSGGLVTYNIVVPGDVDAANNEIEGGTVFYTTANVASMPDVTTFSTGFTDKTGYGKSTDQAGLWLYTTDASAANFANYVGADGTKSGAIVANFYSIQSGSGVIVIGNYNTQGQFTKVSMDMAKSAYAATPEPDSLAIVYSDDCGATWTSIWGAKGADLVTKTGALNKGYFPGSTSEWKNVSGSFTGTSDNQLIGVRAYSGYGNYGWVDNFTVETAPSSVNLLSDDINFKLYPNPAEDHINVNVENKKALDLSVTVMNSIGQKVYSAELNSGTNTLVVPTSDLASGQYVLSISNEGRSITKTFTVK